MDGTTNELSQTYKCRYCGKEFRKESTLVAHVCEIKRRYQQQNETGVQIGLKSYLRFYEVTQGSARLKSYEDFVNSPYYNAFVRYGRHLVAIRAVNTVSFTDWLLKNNKKLDQWCKDSFYETYLQEYIKREAVQDALERALKEMEDYARDSDIANFSHYFLFGNANRICHHICTGRVSAWVVYNCDTGLQFLERLNEDQVGMVMPYIDPDHWNRKFTDYVADVEWAKHVLGQAGL